MNAKKIIIASIPLILFAILILVFKSSLNRDPRKLETKLIGEPIPKFQLGSLTDQLQTLTNADLPKEPFLLNVWATWCVSCYAEHPYLVKFAKENPTKWIGINYKDDTKEALNYLAKGGDPYLFSLTDLKGSLGIDLGVYGAPETFIVDGKGIIRDRHVGVIDDRVWNSIILPKLEQLKTQ